MNLTSPATLLGAGGLAWLLGQGLLPDLGLETPERYDAVVEARGLEAWSAGLLVVAGCLLVLGAFALSRALGDVRGRGSTLISVGAPLLALGGVWLVAGRAAFNMVFLRVTTEEVPREVAIGVLDDGGGAEFIPLLLTLPCLLLGPVLLALGLRRAGLAGWLPLVGWVVGIGVFLATEFTVKAGEIAGIGIAAVALTRIGWSASGKTPASDVDLNSGIAADSPTG
jgi:hypothetical protein